MIRLVVQTRVLLAVTVPPALPSFGCVDVVAALPGKAFVDACASAAHWLASLAMAQTKPDSSRAMAAMTTVGGFPARASLR